MLRHLTQLFPDLCPCCGLESRSGLCAPCRDALPTISAPCIRCGQPKPCTDCPANRPGWAVDAIRAPLLYAPPLTRLVQALKYGKTRSLGRALGELLGERIASQTTGCDALVAVPLHRARLRQRTFNQADEIARPIARRLGVPLLIRGVLRHRDTPPQTTLDRSSRLVGPRRAFRVGRRLDRLGIAVIDDVITTASTVNALAEALKLAGAERVEAWAVARALGDDANVD